jgi:hypothetical protein
MDLLFRGTLPEAGQTSRLRGQKGEGTMKLTLAAMVGALTFALYVVAISTPLQQIERSFESLIR